MTRFELKELIDGLNQKRHILDVQITQIDNELEPLEDAYENSNDGQEILL